jgi:hypothetical protein
VAENNSDPISDMQRWLMKQGARGLAREVTGKVRSTIGQTAGKSDVWDTATTEPPGDEPPECQWCPICRAARMASGGGQGFSAVGDTLAGLAQDAFSVLDSVLRVQGSDNGPVVGSRVPPTRGPVVHPEHQNRESADERRDRKEGGEAGHRPSDRGGDEQVGWPAE